jgi:hypothetical protein
MEWLLHRVFVRSWAAMMTDEKLRTKKICEAVSLVLYLWRKYQCFNANK